MYNVVMSSSQALFEQAEKAILKGQREPALRFLTACVEQDPHHLNAWLWLSELVDNPTDRTTALENALDLSLPGSEMYWGIHARLETLRQYASPAAPVIPTEASILDDLPAKIQQALRLRDAARTTEAVQILELVTTADPRNERAWMLISEMTPDPLEKIYALERVLEINPGHLEAARVREQLRPLEQDALKHGRYLEAQGELDRAAEVYRSVVTHSRYPAERLEASHRMNSIALRKETDSIRKINPTLNLLRLAFGPVVLFSVMIFIQSGLKPLHTPLVAVAGILSVLAGSLLVSTTGIMPAHPRWVALFGSPGTGDEPEMRRGMRLLGWALLLAPFTMFFIEAGHRLGVLQASMLPH
jgi:hypothetical protein